MIAECVRTAFIPAGGGGQAELHYGQKKELVVITHFKYIETQCEFFSFEDDNSFQ